MGGEAIHFPLEGVNNIATDVFGPGPKGLPRLRTTYAENCLMLIPYPAYLLSQCLRDNAYTVVLTAILQDNISDPRGDIIDPYYPIGESYKEASRTRENCANQSKLHLPANWNYHSIPEYSCPKLRRAEDNYLPPPPPGKPT